MSHVCLGLVAVCLCYHQVRLPVEPTLTSRFVCVRFVMWFRGNGRCSKWHIKSDLGITAAFHFASAYVRRRVSDVPL